MIKSVFFSCIIFILLSKSLSAQISSGKEFLKFALLSANEKHLYISENNWKGVGVYRKNENNKVIEDLVYSKIENGVSYGLTLRGIMDYNGNVINVTTLLISDEIIYNNWVKSWKNSGNVFKKDPDSEDKYMSLGNKYTIIIEKIYEDGMTLYQISII